MAKVFISGYVSDAALRSGIHGAAVTAFVNDGRARHAVWQGVTDEWGAFGFELRPSDFPHVCGLVIVVARGQMPLGETELAWDVLATTGTHVDFVVPVRAYEPSKPPSLPFPIAFPGADRPAGQQGPIPIHLERPEHVPVHPMAALPFLVQASRPTDPDEDEGEGDTDREPAPAVLTPSDPP